MVFAKPEIFFIKMIAWIYRDLIFRDLHFNEREMFEKKYEMQKIG